MASRRAHSPHRVDVALPHLRGRQRGGVALQQGQYVHRVHVLLGIEAGDAGADVALELDVSFGLQAADRLADRQGADRQLTGELVEHQPVPRAVGAVKDAPLDRVVDEFKLGDGRGGGRGGLNRDI